MNPENMSPEEAKAWSAYQDWDGQYHTSGYTGAFHEGWVAGFNLAMDRVRDLLTESKSE